MRRIGTRIAWVALLIVFLAGAVRLLLVLSTTECGYEFIRQQVRSASVGWLGLDHVAIDSLDPADQADFWIRKVDHIERSHPMTAELCAGAAWVLDSPGVGFWQQHMKSQQPIPGFPQSGLSLDHAAIKTKTAEFELKCREQSLALAKRATELDPADVRWWRMRALLEFNGDDLRPNDDAWLEVLDECARHDPENALYNYLAALALWTESAKYEMLGGPQGGMRLIVEQDDRFQKGIDRFEQAQQKPYLAIGEAGYPAIAQFLSLSGLPKADQAAFAVSRLVTVRQSWLFYRVWRWQQAQSDEAERRGDGFANALRQLLRMFDQAVAPHETPALNKAIQAERLRHATFARIAAQAEVDPALISEADLKKLTAHDVALTKRAAEMSRAAKKVTARRKSSQNGFTLVGVVTIVTLASTVASLFIAIAALLLGKLLSRATSGRSLGLGRCLSAWLIGYGAAFLALGVAPADFVSRGTARLIITGLFWAVALAAALFIAWRLFQLLKRRQFQFSLRSLFALMTGAAILTLLWPILLLVFSEIETYPTDWLDHSRQFSGLDAEVYRAVLGTAQGTWLWAATQFVMHHGPLKGVVVSLLIVALWSARRAAREGQESFFGYFRREPRIRGAAVLKCLGWSALVASALWMTLYAWTAPELVRANEAAFQDKMRYCRNPEAYYAEFEQALLQEQALQR